MLLIPWVLVSFLLLWWNPMAKSNVGKRRLIYLTVYNPPWRDIRIGTWGWNWSWGHGGKLLTGFLSLLLIHPRTSHTGEINPPTNDHVSGGLTSECHLIPAVTLMAPTLQCLTSHLGFWDLKSGPHVSVTSTLTTELSLQPQWVYFLKSRCNNLPYYPIPWIPLFLFQKRFSSLNFIVPPPNLH